MTESSHGFTSTDLIVASSQTLIANGYRQIVGKFPEWDTPTSRLFEDEYGVVGIVVFDTGAELLRTWPDLQASLVEVISRHVGREEAKSWDGYLVLLSPGIAPSQSTAIDEVRYNTTRLRKLVATADDLLNPTDVERVLRPLLPLPQERANVDRESALDLLPRLLAKQKISEQVTHVLIDAFREQTPLLERLHQLGDVQ
jgi:hypothetical protein